MPADRSYVAQNTAQRDRLSEFVGRADQRAARHAPQGAPRRDRAWPEALARRGRRHDSCHSFGCFSKRPRRSQAMRPLRVVLAVAVLVLVLPSSVLAQVKTFNFSWYT